MSVAFMRLIFGNVFKNSVVWVVKARLLKDVWGVYMHCKSRCLVMDVFGEKG